MTRSDDNSNLLEINKNNFVIGINDEWVTQGRRDAWQRKKYKIKMNKYSE